MLAPLTRALIEAAAIGEGQSVIDIAGGTGEPSLAIAERVGATGYVICTDAVSEMLDVAEREAARRGLSNIKFQQALAGSLPFDNGSFDRAVSRLGVMFFPDPRGAIRDILRVLKPEGRIALAVWAKKEMNPFFYLVSDIISRYIESPPEDPDAPGAFRFAEPGKLARVVEEAGAIDVSERAFEFKIDASLRPEDFWPVRLELSDTLREKAARLSSDHLAAVAEDVKQAAFPYFTGDGISFPARAIIVAATRPLR